MSNITLSIDDAATERARIAAQKMDTSLNQLVRDYIARLGGEANRAQLAEAWLAQAGRGNSRGWKFNRDELQR
jgi:hypothetical protein